jgi:site-specific DNA recombinase
MISPENQEQACRDLANREGLEVVEVVSDLDATGRDFVKRKVGYIIKGVEDGEWDVVVMWKWSRFGRHMLDSMLNLRAIKDAGGKERAATEDFDDATTMGRFTRDQMLLLAQLESDRIGDVWKEAHARRERAGLPHSGLPRFGYNYDEVTKQYLLDPVEGPALRELYMRYVEGGQPAELARWLNDRRVATKRGNPWTPAKLLRMLDTGFGAGVFGVGRASSGQYKRWVCGTHEPVVDMQAWEAYRNRRAGAPPARAMKPRYAVSGLLLCAECGSRLRARGQARRSVQVFECGRHADEPTACPGVYASRHIVEAQISAWLERKAKRAGNPAGAGTGAGLPPREDRLPPAQALASARAKLTGLVELDDEGLIDETTFRERRQALVREVATCQYLISAAQESRPTRAGLLRALRRWDEGSEQERRLVLQELLTGIVVARGRTNSADKYKIVPRWVEVTIGRTADGGDVYDELAEASEGAASGGPRAFQEVNWLSRKGQNRRSEGVSRPTMPF